MEVDEHRRVAGPFPALWRLAIGGLVHERAGAWLRDEVALGHQLVVGGHDHSPGHAEIRGHRPRGWQQGARRQPARPDRVAEPVLDLDPQAALARPVELDKDFTRTGTHRSIRSGP